MTNYKIIYSILFICFLASCATTKKTDSDEDVVQVITLPRSNQKSEIQNMKDARKNLIKIGSQGSSKFDFYYNDLGGYYIVIVSEGDRSFNLSLYDATLIVDDGGNDPEYLALASENSQILSGFGIPRNSLTKYKLVMESIDPSLARSFSFSFNINMGK